MFIALASIKKQRIFLLERKEETSMSGISPRNKLACWVITEGKLPVLHMKISKLFWWRVVKMLQLKFGTQEQAILMQFLRFHNIQVRLKIARFHQMEDGLQAVAQME